MSTAKDVSVLIPARNEMFLRQTIEDVLAHMEADTEVIAVADGAWPDPPIVDHPRVILVHHSESIGQRAATNEAARISRAKYIMKLDAHCALDQGFDKKLMAPYEAGELDHNVTTIPRQYNLHAFD
jgi:glycosyltransferase involved in cell wall biosynthesis